MRRCLLVGRYLFCFAFLANVCFAQKPTTAATPDVGSEMRQALKLAGAGRCREALPILRKAALAGREIAGDLKRQAGFAGVRCAMLGPNPETATDFLRMLSREFPRDPE